MSNFCFLVFFPYSSSSITDSRIGNDQVDLREDLSSEQGGTGSASGSSLSASAYRGNTLSNLLSFKLKFLRFIKNVKKLSIY